MKKKGTIYDLWWIPIALFIFAIIAMAMGPVLTDVTTQFNNSDSISSEAKTQMSDNEQRFPAVFDNIFFFFIIGFVIITLLGAYMIDTNPAFFFIGIIAIIGLSVVVIIFSNAFNFFYQEGAISAASADFPKMTMIMDNFLFFIIMLGILIGVVLYGKTRTG